jgi:hypothetical protein
MLTAWLWAMTLDLERQNEPPTTRATAFSRSRGGGNEPLVPEIFGNDVVPVVPASFRE